MSKMLVRRHGATPIEYGLIAALIATTIAAAAFQYDPHVGKFFSPMMTAMSPAVKSSASLTAPSAPVPVYPTFSSWGSDLNNYTNLPFSLSNINNPAFSDFTGTDYLAIISSNCNLGFSTLDKPNISQSDFLSCLSQDATFAIINNGFNYPGAPGYQLPSFLGGISLNPKTQVVIYPRSTYAQSSYGIPLPKPIFKFSGIQSNSINSTAYFSPSQVSSAKTACVNLGGNFSTDGINATTMNCYTNPSSNINTIGFPNNIGSYFAG